MASLGVAIRPLAAMAAGWHPGLILIAGVPIGWVESYQLIRHPGRLVRNIN